MQWFRGNAPHIEMPMEIANLPEGESTSPSGSVASMMTGVSARVDTAAASRKTEEQERLVETVEKQKKAIDYLKKKKEELEAKLAQGGVIEATAPNGAASSGPRAEELAELQRANEEPVARLKAAKAQEEELVRKLK